MCSFSCVRFPCCSSFNPPRYASFSLTWDAEAASNELASRFLLLPGFTEAPDIPRLFDAIGLDAAEELVAIRQEETFIVSRDLDTTLSLFVLLLNSFYHRSAVNQAEIFGAAKRAEMANIEQMKKIIRLITRENSLWSRCLRVGVWCQCNEFWSGCPN